MKRLAVCILGAMAAVSLAGAQSVEELPTLGGGRARALDVNDLGQVVGFSTHAGESVAEATLWQDGTPVGLGMAAGTNFSYANAINNSGEAAGYSETGAVPDGPGNTWTATFWDAGGAFDIGASMGLHFSLAHDVNDGGVVAVEGNDWDGFGVTSGYVWSRAMGGLPAGADPFYRYAANFGINNANDLVGYAAAGFDGNQAILARFDGVDWELGVEIGPQGVRDPAFAFAISDGGVIVGLAGDGGRHRSPEAALFTLDPKRPVTWLDKLDDFDDSVALDLNESGLIVGDSLRTVETGEDQRAVVWVNEEIYDLNNLLTPRSSFRQLISATGVNEDGDIVGYGVLADGSERAFVIKALVKGLGRLGQPGKPASLSLR